MIRLFRLRCVHKVLQPVVCYSDGPSTSREVGEEEQESNVRRAAEEESTKRALQETRSRIRRWRTRASDLQEEESASSARRIDAAAFERAATYEEQQYGERADEIVKVLSEMAAPANPKTLLATPKMSAKDVELKKKTGKVKFRGVIYDEGELDKSDLSKPPSPENPHPFDPETCSPPIYSRSIAPYVNKMPSLQILVDLGVNLFEIDTTTNCGKFLLRLDQERDIKPKLQWLVSIGLEPSDIGDYITRNPFFLLQDLHDMQARVNYLEMHKFKPQQITKIVKEFRYWINTDVKTMDARLGWIQKQFQLKGNDVRAVITKEPRFIMFGLGPLKRLFDILSRESEFTMAEIKKILVDDPRVFMMDPRYVQNNYNFVSRVMRLPNSVIAATPFLLRCSISNLKNRHDFLRKLGRAHYEGQKAGCTAESPDDDLDHVEQVALSDLLHPSDAHFASRAAKSYVVVYDKFLRSH